MEKIIDIGTKINLSSLLLSRLLVQANSGGGKSGVARVLIEETYGIVPFIMLDVEGEYYTLKEKFGDIIIVGGHYADVPISLKILGLLAKEIIGNRLSVVIDISDLKIHDRIMYVKYFLEGLMSLPKQYWISYFIFVEEAHMLAGQQDMQESGPAVKDLMTRGRKRGYCGILVTQRISKLHKDCAAECNNKFIGRTWLDVDIDRSAKELGFRRGDDANKLRDLEARQFFAFGVSIEPHHVHQVTIKKAETKFPKSGAVIDIKPQKPTAKILSALQKLNELPQEIDKKLKTESDLRKEVDRLTRELGFKNNGKPINEEQIKNDVQKWKEMAGGFEKENKELKNLHESAMKIIGSVQSIVNNVPSTYKTKMEFKFTGDKKVLDKFQKEMKNASKPNVIIIPKDGGSVKSNGSLPPGEKAVLIACVQFGHALGRDQLTVLTTYKRSSRDAYISRLKEKGFVEQEGDKIAATTEGEKYLGDNFERLPTGRELQEYWLNKLPPGEKAVLEILIDHYPEDVDRETISEKTGYQRSSRDAYISRMIPKEIAVVSAKGRVKASENLF